jgi:hypothetical protein
MKRLPFWIHLTTSAGLMVMAACSAEVTGLADGTGTGAADLLVTRPGLLFVGYRGLNGANDGVALIDLEPTSLDFGGIVDRHDLAAGVLPHHLYFNRDQDRLYTTALGGPFLYEINLDWDLLGQPWIDGVAPINTYGNTVGEDMYFTLDGTRYYVTFMGGDGSAQGGSVGMFNAVDNSLLDVIVAPKPADPTSTAPFIMYPHGISANEDLGRLMVTSTIHPDLSTGVGNTVTSIDLATNEPVQTYLVADSPSDLTAPVEVLLLRDDLPPYALTTTMLGGDIWIAAYDQATGEHGPFTKAIEGDASGISWPLEFYVHEDQGGAKELYVTFAVPGVVNVYSLDNLPTLTLERSFPAGAGAHHMVFFRTTLGRELVAVQNNLLNLDGLNAGTITVHDIHTGELLRTLDMRSRYGLMPESIEWAYGHGHDYHH